MVNQKAKEVEVANNPSTEAELIAVTVGVPEVLNSTIHLANHDPGWSLVFAELEQKIRDGLGDQVLLLEHIGSTSLPGLAAKPIIDMVLAVADSSNESSYVPQLETLGYTLKIREPNWYEHRVLKLQEPKANLHVFSVGCEQIKRMIAFRDWLRNHAEDRRLYELTKRQLSQKTWKYLQNYADAKSAVILEIMNRAYSR